MKLNFIKKIKEAIPSNRRIRQYCLYAMGEIILVMIGILLALQVNNWNEQRKKNQLEKDSLMLMVEDLKTDKEALDKQHVIHLEYLQNNKKAIQFFNNATSLEDIRKVIALRFFKPDELSVNNPTFEEMLNNSTLNTISNKILRQKIKRHYKNVEERVYDIRASNTDKIRLENNPSYYPIQILISQSYAEVYDEKFDVSWINNPTSITYQALKLQLDNSRGLTLIKLAHIEELIKNSEVLINEINQELKTLNHL